MSPKSSPKETGKKETGKAKSKKVQSTATMPSDYVPRLKGMYQEKVLPAMMKEFGYKNPMQVPRIERIVINVGMGEAVQNVKLLESAAAELEQITGQKPILRRAKKAIAGFKLRAGMPIGVKVTLRTLSMTTRTTRRHLTGRWENREKKDTDFAFWLFSKPNGRPMMGSAAV